jgi:hypothetical protein
MRPAGVSLPAAGLLLLGNGLPRSGVMVSMRGVAAAIASAGLGVALDGCGGERIPASLGPSTSTPGMFGVIMTDTPSNRPGSPGSSTSEPPLSHITPRTMTRPTEPPKTPSDAFYPAHLHRERDSARTDGMHPPDARQPCGGRSHRAARCGSVGASASDGRRHASPGDSVRLRGVDDGCAVGRRG